jgi:hypothetical protein
MARRTQSKSAIADDDDDDDVVEMEEEGLTFLAGAFPASFSIPNFGFLVTT